MTPPETDTAERQPLTNDQDIDVTLKALLFPEEMPQVAESAQEPPEAGEPAEEETTEQPAEDVEASAETESDEEPEAAEEAPETHEPQSRRVRVPLEDGTTEEITEDELVKGYRRERDYTRKTQELAEARKKWESEEVQALRAERERYAAALPEIENALKPETPDWDKIRQERPDEFPAIYASWKVADERYQAVRQERERAEAQVQKDRAQALQKYLADERAKLFEKLPEIREEANAKALATYLKDSYGFTDHDINTAADHRLLVMAHKAKSFDDLMKQKPKVEEKAESKIKPAKPGVPSSTTKPKPTELDRAANRLRKTGSTEDLEAVLNQAFKRT
jgi:hypothetical protein